jgi:hypothetical protein
MSSSRIDGAWAAAEEEVELAGSTVAGNQENNKLAALPEIREAASFWNCLSLHPLMLFFQGRVCTCLGLQPEPSLSCAQILLDSARTVRGAIFVHRLTPEI